MLASKVTAKGQSCQVRRIQNLVTDPSYLKTYGRQDAKAEAIAAQTLSKIDIDSFRLYYHKPLSKNSTVHHQHPPTLLQARFVRFLAPRYLGSDARRLGQQQQP